ncbi:MAG: LLM class flavin-dependent oxidoreductase [Acidimicrobiales bacterium]
MRHAVFVPIFDELADPITVARLAVDAEAAGWDGFFVWDHIAYRRVDDVGDTWITLAAVACATRDVRLGPMVTPLPRRRPLKVAREVVSLDLLSRGRVTLGVGIAGDGSRELSGTGEELDAKVRGSMLDEGLEVLEAAWSEGPTTHRGEHYVVDHLVTGPRPLQLPRPPIWVAVRQGNQKPLARAARYEGVFPVDLSGPKGLAEIVAGVNEHRAPDAAPLEVAAMVGPDDDRTAYAEAGATWMLTKFSPFDLPLAHVQEVVRAGPPAV